MTRIALLAVLFALAGAAGCGRTTPEAPTATDLTPVKGKPRPFADAAGGRAGGVAATTFKRLD